MVKAGQTLFHERSLPRKDGRGQDDALLPTPITGGRWEGPPMPSAQPAGPAETGQRRANPKCWKGLTPLPSPPPPTHNTPSALLSVQLLPTNRALDSELSCAQESAETVKRLYPGRCAKWVRVLFLCLNGLFGFVYLLRFLGWLLDLLKGRATLRNRDW